MNKLHAAIALSAFAAVLGPAQASDKDVVEALYSQVLSGTTSPDLRSRVEAVLAPSWRSVGDYASPEKTREQFFAQLQQMGATAPTLTWKVEEVLQTGNRFVVRGRARATPTGTFLGVPATGRGFDIMAIDIHTVENNKIVMSYHVEDWHRAIEQIQSR
jgi:predicted ester cyclase